jgi:hypothetical protein
MSFLTPKPPPPIQPVDPAQAANRANSVLAQQLASGGRNATFLSTMANNTGGARAPTLTGLSG